MSAVDHTGNYIIREEKTRAESFYDGGFELFQRVCISPIEERILKIEVLCRHGVRCERRFGCLFWRFLTDGNVEGFEGVRVTEITTDSRYLGSAASAAIRRHIIAEQMIVYSCRSIGKSRQ